MFGECDDERTGWIGQAEKGTERAGESKEEEEEAKEKGGGMDMSWFGEARVFPFCLLITVGEAVFRFTAGKRMCAVGEAALHSSIDFEAQAQLYLVLCEAIKRENN